MNNTTTKQWITRIGIMTLAKMSSLLKLSFVFGTFFTCFSASCITIPLIGLLGGTFSTMVFFTITLLSRLVLGYGISFKILAYYIPGLCASLYLAQRSALLAVGLPIICMIAFILHPVGHDAALYTAYWLIPLLLLCIPQKTVFTHALTATFIAHAVGSTLWIYTHPTTPALWLALIPIVALERLIYALGITVMHTAITVVVGTKRVRETTPHIQHIL